MNCTLCDTKLKVLADEYYFICDTCGAYVKDRKYYLSSSEEKDRYLSHNNDVNNVGYQNFTLPITDAIFKNHSIEQLGLDYGCGTGPVISKQLETKGYKVKLYDLYFYPNQDNLNHQFDYIFSCEVFEHFHHPKQEIEKLLKLLKPVGTLYIMTHLYNAEIDFKNWYYRKDPTHIFIYTLKTIDFIISKYGLRIEKLTDRLIIIKKLPTTRNIRKPGIVGKLNFCTFTQSCNGLISWSFEIPASAYCKPLGKMPEVLNWNDISVADVVAIWVRSGRIILMFTSRSTLLGYCTYVLGLPPLPSLLEPTRQTLVV